MSRFNKIIFLVISFIFFVIFAQPIKAENEFSVDTTVTYDVQENGKTIVSHDITLENNFSDLYATTYTLGMENIDASNIRAENDQGVLYNTDISTEGENTNIKVSFPDTSVGKGVRRHFRVIYENSSFAVRTGEVWELSIPKIAPENNFRNFQLILKVPKLFGLEAYVSPSPTSRDFSDNGYIYTFNKDNVVQTGISAGFGQFQVFTYNLSYHLENPLSRSSSTQISLPPDTAFQKVYIQNINPRPVNVFVDADGNWIATYDLSPRQRIDVVVSGAVQIFASYRSFPKPSDEQLAENLKETKYWQVNDERIKELAAIYKTPKEIYDFVSQKLQYDFDRVKSTTQRMGAVGALENSKSALCMEYTDLFIAIARAAGIPAREVNGYAYTEKPELQPLGLVADVLHAWPEYFNEEHKVWIPVDPTWGSTTGGVDFFDKLDLRHFAFVIHGQSDTEPYPAGSYKLGANPQKDVYVSFGQLPDSRISIPKISIEPYRILPFFSSIYTVNISNPGPVALYNLNPIIYYDSTEKSRDSIQALPPFGNKQIQINQAYSFLGKDTPNIISVNANSSSAQVVTNKKQIIINSLVAILILLLVITAFVLARVKRKAIYNFFAKITNREDKDEKSIKEITQNTDKGRNL